MLFRSRKENYDAILFFESVCDVLRIALVSRIAKEKIVQLFPYATKDEIAYADDLQVKVGKSLTSENLVHFLETSALARSLSDPFLAYESLVLEKSE